MREPVLSIEGLRFGYSPEALLYEDFSLTLHVGEVISVVGPSGSGKTTLFELITGSLKPLGGTLTCKAFSQIFQDPYTSFHPTYTLFEQMAEVADTQEHERLCDALGLSPVLLHRKPHELSGGQLQRASIIRALLMKPKLLLADEPTSALDNLIQLEVMQLLMGLLDDIGILLITHDETLASWCSDSIIRLKS
ncbi:MAG: ATP-binding cassette domain-containing protein [Campylobacterales bacterium]|nr:ATP-binding cassette domain-containing protein [Campylobacterales bacterium]